MSESFVLNTSVFSKQIPDGQRVSVVVEIDCQLILDSIRKTFPKANEIVVSSTLTKVDDSPDCTGDLAGDKTVFFLVNSFLTTKNLKSKNLKGKGKKESNIDKSKYPEGTLNKDDDEFGESSLANEVLGKFIHMVAKKNEKLLDVEQWTAHQFGDYLRMKFKDTYSTDSIELLKFKGQPLKFRGKEYVLINRKLIKVFIDQGHHKTDVVKYIDWLYDVKSKDIKFPINLTFVLNDTVITEYFVESINGATEDTKTFNKEFEADF